MKSFVWLAAVLIATAAFSGNALADGKKLRFNASVRMPFSNAENTGFEDRLVKEMFCRLGYAVNVRFVVAERALHSLSDGYDDGALGRVHGVTAKYPGIIEIEEQAFVRDFVVYTRKEDKVDPGWDGLKNLKVGFVTGWKIVENNMQNANNITEVPTGKQLFQMLAKKRIDAAIFSRWGGLQMLKDLDIKDVALHEPPLTRAPHHFVMNREHSDIAKDASEVLIEMKQDGAYDRIFNETLRPLDPAEETAGTLYNADTTTSSGKAAFLCSD